MNTLIYKLEGLMQTNIYTCRETFNNFYNYGNHKCESERKIVNSFKSDFEKMSMIDSFNEYISNEIPNFNQKWVTDYYGYTDIDIQVLERIHQNLQKQNIKYRSKVNLMLPELRNESISKRSVPRSSIKILSKNQFAEQEEIKADTNNEYLDRNQLETDFYMGLKQEIDQFLLKAWEGKADLTEDELRRFREIMRYKQG